MKVTTLFSGIGGFDLAFENAGAEIVAQVEIDPKAFQILERHFPDAERFNDVRTVGKHNLKPVDVICGGFPCQDLSVAGKRAGLAGERSGLWFEFARIIDELEPRWVVIENVPGLLSSDRGRDFAVILQWLAKRGYGVAWRVLDAQYFGVAQRRRRVFVVASFRNGRCAEILFECEGMFRNTPPSREARQGYSAIAGTLASSGSGLDRPSGNGNQLDFCIPVSPSLVSNGDAHSGFRDERGLVTGSVSSKWAKGTGGPAGDECYNLVAFQQNTRDEVRKFGGDGQIAGALPAQPGMKQQNYIAFSAGNSTDSYGIGASENVTPPIRAGNSGTNQAPTIAGMVGVRRLTPTECERLQGFPDGWTDGQSDSARYRQLGNAVAVPCVQWLAERIVKS